MKIVIPSKGRADVIGDKALRLFPDATLCVGESETAAYGRLSDRLLVHPDTVAGIGPLRQWVLDHVDDPCVVMVDDDPGGMHSRAGGAPVCSGPWLRPHGQARTLQTTPPTNVRDHASH